MKENEDLLNLAKELRSFSQGNSSNPSREELGAKIAALSQEQINKPFIKSPNGPMNFLMWAAYNGYSEAVRLLLEYGKEKIDINAQQTTESKATALHFAIYEGRHEVTGLLLKESEIDLNIKDDRNCYPFNLFVLRDEKNDETKRQLISQFIDNQKLDINAPGYDGSTALSMAMQGNRYQKEVVDEILKQRPDVRVGIKNNRGKSAIDYARENDVKVLDSLLERRKWYEVLSDFIDNLFSTIAEFISSFGSKKKNVSSVLDKTPLLKDSKQYEHMVELTEVTHFKNSKNAKHTKDGSNNNEESIQKW